MEDSVQDLRMIGEEEIDSEVTLQSLCSWVKSKKKIRSNLPEVKSKNENRSATLRNKKSCISPQKFDNLIKIRRAAASPTPLKLKVSKPQNNKFIRNFYRDHSSVTYIQFNPKMLLEKLNFNHRKIISIQSVLKDHSRPVSPLHTYKLIDKHFNTKSISSIFLN